MNKYDAIVIGSGLGGLVCGALLARDGKKVLVIEQYTIPGGCARTFQRKGFNLEVALHEMDGLDKGDSKMEVFRKLDILRHIKIQTLSEFYRFIHHETDIMIPNDSKKTINVLTERYPDETKGIKKFFRTLSGIRRDINRLPHVRGKVHMLLPLFPFIYPHIFFNLFKTLGKFLDSIIKNEELKLILNGNIMYYGDDPYSLSLLYYGVAQGSYYIGGGHFIKGGSQNLSDFLTGYIQKRKGIVLLGHRVTKIITEKKKATGVEYVKTTDKNSRPSTEFSKVIVSNASVPQVVNHLLPGDINNRFKNRINKMQKGCSLTNIFLCFKKNIKQLNKHYSTFVFPDHIRSQKDIADHFKDKYPKKSFVFLDYSQIDSGLAPKGKSLGVISLIDYLSNWEKLNPKQYKKKKEQVARIYIKKLENLIPGITKLIEYYEVSTPKTIQKYTLNPGGTPYGFKQLPLQAGIFRIGAKSPVKDLFFASAWVHPGGGFSATFFSGLCCYKEILAIK
ncbi:MAG: NAD(P)/FAD-dependent oxidoreductase [Spirochaetes bacterium]|nr:NAD(P)/FAD-dependent oxidoreductase [Spirochaetota bacterium]